MVTNTLTDFYGQDLDLKLCELRGMKIDPVHREGEADLMRARWFDHARLHPVHATYLYAHLYRETTRTFCETCVDVRTAADQQAFFPEDIFLSRDLTSMWLARREADKLGLPYVFVLQTAMNVFFNKLFHRFPRPNQLYGEEFVMDLNDAWKARMERSLVYSRQPYFMATAFKGDLLQVRHINYIIEQIKRRESVEGPLARLLFEGVLSPRLLAGRFEQAVIDRAEQMASRLG